MFEGSSNGISRSWRAPEALLALVLAISALATVFDVVPRMVGIDYYLYWVVGSAHAKHEITDVYATAEEQRVGEMYFRRARQEFAQLGQGAQPTRRVQAAAVRRRLDNYSTPFLYTVYGALVSGDYERDLDRVNRAASALYFLGIVALCAALGYSLTGTLVAVAALSMWFNPFVDDLSVGNVNRAQLGLLGIFAWLSGARRIPWRHVLAGCVLGVALMFKPNVAHAALVLGIAWIASRQYRKLAHVVLGGAIGVVACLGASLAYFGSLQPWVRWVEKLSGLMSTWSTEEGVQSLSRVAFDRFGFGFTGVLAPLFVGAVVAVLACVRVRRSAAADDSADDERERARTRWDILLLALGVVASVLSTKLVWQHYYVLTIPLALYLLRPEATRRGPARIAAAVALICVSVDVVMKLSGGRADPASCVVLGTLALFALGLLEGLRTSHAQLVPAPR